MKTCADIFAEQGNPWVTERERHDTGHVSRGQLRRNRQPRPCERAYPEPCPIGRELTPEEAKAKAQMAMLAHVRRLAKATRGGETRASAGYQPKRAYTERVLPKRDRPVSEWDADKIADDLARLARRQEQQTRGAKSDEPVRLLARRELGGAIAL